MKETRSVSYRPVNDTLNCRSILCTPITKEVDLLRTSFEGDAIVFDLEDSIPADQKKKARSLLSKRLNSARTIASKPKVFVRINSPKTIDGVEDLVSLLACENGPDVIHLPKVETKEEIQFVSQFIIHHFPLTRLQLIIETAKGLSIISDILKEIRSVDGLVFGAADFASDIGSNIDWDSLKIYRTELVKIAKLNNLQVIDSPYFDYEDLDGLQREVSDSYELGFSGKIAIHPAQVSVINQGFLPNMQDVLEAFEILDEALKQSAPIFSFKGKMIGPPILNCAKRVVDTYYLFNMERNRG